MLYDNDETHAILKHLSFENISWEEYPETLLQAGTLQGLKSIPSETKPFPIFISATPGKHFEKAEYTCTFNNEIIHVVHVYTKSNSVSSREELNLRF